MITLTAGSLEARIIEFIGDQVIEKRLLARRLRLREKTLDASLRRLASAGIIGLDALPDKVYVRRLTNDYIVSGVKPTLKRKLVRETKKTKARKYEGMMYR